MPLPEPDPLPLTGAPHLNPSSENVETGLFLAPGGKRSPRRYRWYHKVAGVLAAIFCFELGVFLLVYPWASDWDVNYFAFLPLWARPVWSSPYFRGAVSGLGILNIYISFVEVFRLRRFSR